MIPLAINDSLAKAHFLTIKDKIITRIGNIQKRCITRTTKKAGKKKIVLSTSDNNLLNWLKAENNLEKIICASPLRLKSFIRILCNNYPIRNKNSNINFILFNIFISSCYDKQNVFDKHRFIVNLGLDTCCYCNRNYIYSLDKKNLIKPQIDHFYPKTIYPFLGMSFYNLIPSCQTCNGMEVKSNQDTYILKAVNPYLLIDDSFVFTYDFNDINIINPLRDFNNIDILFSKKVNANNLLFKLDKLYNLHKDHVAELIVKSKMNYSSEYRKSLQKINNFKFDDSEIDRMILGNYINKIDLHRRPLSKLYKDIGKELGLISSI